MKIKARGPPFVEVHGELWLNLAFDMPPLGDDPPAEAARLLSLSGNRADLLILRRLDDLHRRTIQRRWKQMQHEL